MKKRVRILVVLLLVALLMPTNTLAVTLGEYEAAVEKYTKELREKEAKIAKGKEEIAAVKKTIAETEQKIKDTQAEVNRLQEEIERCADGHFLEGIRQHLFPEIIVMVLS